jgi:hypothetical protein
MPKQTLQQRYVVALEARGAKIVSGKSRKYVTLAHTGNVYYVGKAGSVRRGRTYTESVPISDRLKTSLLEAS